MDKGVSIRFIVPRDKMQHVFNAEKELAKAGITFDTGCCMDPNLFIRDWEFDSSLKGHVEIAIK